MDGVLMQRGPGLGVRVRSFKGKKRRRIYYEHVNQRMEDMTKNGELFRESDLMTVQDVAKALRFSEFTVRKWARAGFITARKTPTGRVYFLRSDFDKKSPVREKTLCVKEAAAKLKKAVSTILRWINDGNLPAYKLGFRWQIPEESLIDFLDAGWE